MVKSNKNKRKKRFLRRIIFIWSLVTIFAAFFLITLKPGSSTCGNSISCIKDLSGKYQNQSEGTFLGQKVYAPKEIFEKTYQASNRVLGEKTVKKHIYVDLSNQKLIAYEDDKIVFTFPISSGKWYPTPTGDYKIWVKLRYTRMEGGNPAAGTYYNLPNVPFVMFFYNDQISKSRGFSIHGTYWHNNFGHPMSHGCVNMRIEDAEKLFYWTDPPPTGNTTYANNQDESTPVTIYGITPNE